ncbi:MAG TPA: potassium transporter TrkA [Micromonosporaceae bacterium]|nr:potassium transporter TrkA [Micromonosporaceae bacterium]
MTPALSPPPGLPTLAVLGSGSLARAVCYGLAGVVAYPAEIVVVARSARAVADLCHVATVRAALCGHPIHFRPVVAALSGGDALAEVLGAARPDGVLLCASTQSPWERLTAPSGWTALVERAGFGLTLPLHAELALAAGRAAGAVSPRPWFLNACFPDAVNPALAACGVPVLAGVGNVATLAAGLQAALRVTDPGRLAVLAHHLHLHAPADPGDEARVWCDGAEVGEVGSLLAAQRAVSRRELNQVTGYAAALLLRDLLAGAEVATHVPGPQGRPGGYPVLIGPGRVALRLPAGVTEAEATAANQRWAALDGVAVDAGRVVFGPAAEEHLRRLAPDLAGGFPLAEVAGAAARLHELRDLLRTAGPGADPAETRPPGVAQGREAAAVAT